MKIGYASHDWAKATDADGHPYPGGSCWYRCVQPAKWLTLSGAHVTVVGTLAERHADGALGVADWDGVHHFDCDVVVLQRWMLEGLDESIRRARALGQVVVNDLDDAMWHLHRDNAAAAWTNRFDDWSLEHYRRILAASTAVTVSTPALADMMRPILGAGVELIVVRNAIDLTLWPPPRPRNPDVPLTVGWVGSTVHRSGDLETLRGVLGPLLQRRGWVFHHSGWLDGTPYAAELAGVWGNSTVSPMAPPHAMWALYAPLDVGLVPLNLRAPFNSAKSAVKGLEYVAAGAPFVAHPSPEYRWLHDTHGIGVLAEKPRHWAAAIERVAADPATVVAPWRVELEQFSMAQRWPMWEDLYRSLTAR